MVCKRGIDFEIAKIDGLALRVENHFDDAKAFGERVEQTQIPCLGLSQRHLRLFAFRDVAQHDAADGALAFVLAQGGLQPHPECRLIRLDHPQFADLWRGGLKQSFAMKIVDVLVILVDEAHDWLPDQRRPGQAQQGRSGVVDV